MSHGYRYRATAPETCQWRTLDDMVLVFHRPSGLTHILTQPAPAIAEVLKGEALTPEAVVAVLHARFDVSDDAEFADENRAVSIVSDRLIELWQLGIVERYADAA